MESAFHTCLLYSEKNPCTKPFRNIPKILLSGTATRFLKVKHHEKKSIFGLAENELANGFCDGF